LPDVSRLFWCGSNVRRLPQPAGDGQNEIQVPPPPGNSGILVFLLDYNSSKANFGKKIGFPAVDFFLAAPAAKTTGPNRVGVEVEVEARWLAGNRGLSHHPTRKGEINNLPAPNRCSSCVDVVARVALVEAGGLCSGYWERESNVSAPSMGRQYSSFIGDFSWCVDGGTSFYMNGPDRAEEGQESSLQRDFWV